MSKSAYKLLFYVFCFMGVCIEKKILYTCIVIGTVYYVLVQDIFEFPVVNHRIFYLFSSKYVVSWNNIFKTI